MTLQEVSDSFGFDVPDLRCQLELTDRRQAADSDLTIFRTRCEEFTVGRETDASDV